MIFLRRSIQVLACLIVLSNASASDWIGGMVSTDTLYAGETNAFLMNAGPHQAEQLEANLQANYAFTGPERCRDGLSDTLRTVDIQSFNDTIVTITFDIPDFAYPVEWDLWLNNGMSYYPMKMITKPYILSQPINDTLCQGETASFDICAYGTDGIYYEWYRNGISIQRNYEDPTLIIESVELADTGKYYCLLEGWGNDTVYSDTVLLKIRELTGYQEIPDGPTTLNYSEEPIEYAIRDHEMITGYYWFMLPEEASTIDVQTDTSVTITWKSEFTGIAGLFVETTLGDCPGPNSDTLWINFTGLPQPPKMIGNMVSTDTLFAGETNTFLMNAGPHQADQLVADLQANFALTGPERCQDVIGDTLRAVDIKSFNDTIVTLSFNIPSYAYPTDWDLSLSNGMTYYPMKMITIPYILSQAINDTVCQGETAFFDICAYGTDGIYYEWYRNGISIQRNYENPTLIIESVEQADTGMIHCSLEGWGNDTIYTDTVYLRLKPMPDQQGIPEGPAFISYTEDPVLYRIRYNELVTAYNWILIPENAGIIDEPEDSVVGVTWNVDFSGQAGLFVETTIGECQGINSDTLWIKVAGKPETQEICIVGLDESTENCRIVWNKSADPSVSHYNIYRETNQAGVFLRLDSILASAFSVYVDSNSRPEMYPHSYKMSITDTSEIESELSQTHTTMLLIANRGIHDNHNLNWTPYQGFAFLSYEIYRGFSRDSMTYLNTIPSNVNVFLDLDPPPGAIYYQVVARNADGCIPAKKSGIDYSLTHSNIEKIHIHDGITGQYPDKPFRISPNPASNTIRVVYSGAWNYPLNFSLINLTGKKCGHFVIEHHTQEFDISMFKPGIYLLQLEESNGNVFQKLIISR